MYSKKASCFFFNKVYYDEMSVTTEFSKFVPKKYIFAILFYLTSVPEVYLNHSFKWCDSVILNKTQDKLINKW